MSEDGLTAIRGGRLVTSNVNITLEVEKGVWQSVPIGERYLKFKTEQ